MKDIKITKQMIEDLFNLITAALNLYAKVPPNAKTLTKEQVVADVLAKTFDALKTDLEKYFVSPGNNALDNPEFVEELKNQIAELKAKQASNPAKTFEEIWTLAAPLLQLIEATAKANLPANSTALHVIITVIDTITAMGNALNIDLPKLK